MHQETFELNCSRTSLALALYARRPQKRQDVSFCTHEGVQNGKIFMRVSLPA